MDKFNDVYQEVYKQSGQELEQLKNEKKVKHIIMLIAIIAMALITILCKVYFLWIGVIGVLIWLIVSYNRQYNNYKKVYKEKIIKRFVNAYSDKLEYFSNRGLSSMEYDQGEFDGFYDIYHSEDLIEGTILEDCKISMAEVHTEREEETTDSDGNTSTTYVTLFHGLCAKIELPKPISFNLKIRKNSLLSNIFKGKTKLDMDSGSFEKIFDVNTSDKIQSMRILTADVMQMLIDFKSSNKIVPEITLKENMLFIRYSTGEVFEPNLVKKDMDYDKLKKYYDIINFTLGLAETFGKNIIEFDE